MIASYIPSWVSEAASRSEDGEGNLLMMFWADGRVRRGLRFKVRYAVLYALVSSSFLGRSIPLVRY